MVSERFITGDAYLSAYLSLKLAKPELVMNRGRVLFSFPKSEELYHHVYEFNAGALVDVREFTEALKRARSDIYTMKVGGAR
jgi:hypothetical protein